MEGANAGASGEFVEGWLVAQVLGEGAYGEVRLLVHARSGAAVALKAVRGEEGAREAALHRALRHPHVLRCLGERAQPPLHYMFLEYAQGGELFDRIEPDVGMPERAARRYWRQLVAGLRYLHARGLAHRDLKPENLLLDHRDRLKISDFGLATLFRHGGRERLLSRVCGTVPYAAPEVLAAAERPYRAEPADTWAAAVVLVAMLAGELPWERAAGGEPRYEAWCATRGEAAAAGVWRKLSVGALALLRQALAPEPQKRVALDALQRHVWLRRDDDDATSSLRAREGGSDGESEADGGDSRVWCSQPGAGAAVDVSARLMDELVSFSQPAGAGSGAGGKVLQRLVRRATRLWLRCEEREAVQALLEVLRERRYGWRLLHPRIVAIDCGGGVRMRAWVLRAAPAASDASASSDARVVLEVRRSRGCGLEFKRRYAELRDALQSLAAPPPADPLADLLAEPLAAPTHPRALDAMEVA